MRYPGWNSTGSQQFLLKELKRPSNAPEIIPLENDCDCEKLSFFFFTSARFKRSASRDFSVLFISVDIHMKFVIGGWIRFIFHLNVVFTFKFVKNMLRRYFVAYTTFPNHAT
jgi:hypothetical protein